ncbi:MAG: hypothetical protein AB7P44_13180 [Steroidobacteraceae bacterium]
MKAATPARSNRLISQVLNVVLALGVLCIPPMPTHAEPAPRESLRQRALGATATLSSGRPTGQCIYACDDRMITLKRCPDGECPEYDCKTGEATCRSR